MAPWSSGRRESRGRDRQSADSAPSAAWVWSSPRPPHLGWGGMRWGGVEWSQDVVSGMEARILCKVRGNAARDTEDRHQRHMEESDILSPNPELELAERLNKWHRLDIAYGAAKLDDADIRRAGLAVSWYPRHTLDPIHDAIRHVWYHLWCAASQGADERKRTLAFGMDHQWTSHATPSGRADERRSTSLQQLPQCPTVHSIHPIARRRPHLSASPSTAKHGQHAHARPHTPTCTVFPR